MPELVVENELAIRANDGLITDSYEDSSNVPSALEDQKEETTTWSSQLKAKAKQHKFILQILIAILLAFAWPQGGFYLAPDITAGWIAVIFIFVMNGP